MRGGVHVPVGAVELAEMTGSEHVAREGPVGTVRFPSVFKPQLDSVGVSLGGMTADRHEPTGGYPQELALQCLVFVGPELEWVEAVGVLRAEEAQQLRMVAAPEDFQDQRPRPRASLGGGGAGYPVDAIGGESGPGFAEVMGFPLEQSGVGVAKRGANRRLEDGLVDASRAPRLHR